MRRTVLGVMIAAAAMVGCGGEAPRKVDAAGSPPVVTVQAQTVAAGEWPETYEATGTVRARAVTSVSSRLMAYVREVSAQVGDHVREGQKLVTLDARDLDASVSRAEAARAEVRSAVPEAEQGIAAAKAQLDLAQATFRRMEELASKKSVSSQELDEASARLKSAQAAFEMARAKRIQLDSRAAQVEQEIRSAGIMRDYAVLSAPFAGVVTARSVEPGNLASPGTPLLTIEREGAYRLEAAVDESRLPAVKTGQAVEVVLDADTKRIAARVSEVVPSVDAVSRSYIVKIDLPPAAGLRSGMFGRAAFPMGARKVMAIPVSALVERGQLQSVMAIEDGVARTRLVTTGRRNGEMVEVLSGLTAGERVVAPVHPGLNDGARVEVRQ